MPKDRTTEPARFEAVDTNPLHAMVTQLKAEGIEGHVLDLYKLAAMVLIWDSLQLIRKRSDEIGG
jgi:hypothetical protein